MVEMALKRAAECGRVRRIWTLNTPRERVLRGAVNMLRVDGLMSARGSGRGRRGAFENRRKKGEKEGEQRVEYEWACDVW